jgi:hypothetical protein
MCEDFNKKLNELQKELEDKQKSDKEGSDYWLHLHTKYSIIIIYIILLL